LIGQWGCEPVYTSYRLACFVRPTQVYGRKVQRSELQKADAAVEIGERRSESGVGVSLFWPMDFLRFPFFTFLLFTFWFLVYFYVVMSIYNDQGA